MVFKQLSGSMFHDINKTRDYTLAGQRRLRKVEHVGRHIAVRRFLVQSHAPPESGSK